MDRLTSYLVRPPILVLYVVFTLVLFIGAGIFGAEIFKYKEAEAVKRHLTKETEQISYFLAGVNNLVSANETNSNPAEIKQKFIEQLVKTYPNIRSAWIKDRSKEKVAQADTGDILHSKASFDHEIPIYALVKGEREQIGSFGIQWDLTKEYAGVDQRLKNARKYGILIGGGLFTVLFLFTGWFVFIPLRRGISHGDDILSGNLASNPVRKFGIPKELYILMKQVNRLAERMRFMQQREKEVNAVINSALDGVISIDSVGRVITFNPAAEAIFGYSAKEAIGVDMADLIVPDNLRSAHRQGMSRYLKTGEHKVLGQRIEITALHKDGHEFPVELAIESITEAEGTTFVAYLRNIAEQKETEKELSEQAKASEDLAKTKSALFTATVQEAIAPVKGLQHTLDSLKASSDLSDAQAKLLNTSDSSAKLLACIVNDLAEFSKIDVGAVELDFAPFNIRSAIDTVLQMGHEIVPVENDKLDQEIASDVPNIIIGDQQRYIQILLNIILQATNQTKNSDVMIRVKSIPVETATLMLRTEIYLNGVGISNDVREAIHAPIAEAVNNQFGLNIVLTRKLISLMGGKFDLILEKDKDAIFWFEIPVSIPNNA
ncbi:PAS domain S-box protein [Kordiimonas sp. SCSIO 12610]|uniref:PAS domain S-box protein n=1 Tax=Kordiimonas sp. SCSIO 12610 TaxID=2829597 RepID=UPI0021091DBC|nr:PAS domain S-box protein [Kordiimonas sp. SCSIO 12610]UTW53943.1 PAS domain S-box protein [Kordiimonas sp. SCSIO 12610]